MTRSEFMIKMAQYYEAQWCSRTAMAQVELDEFYRTFGYMAEADFIELMKLTIRISGHFRPTIQKICDLRIQFGLFTYREDDAEECRYCGWSGFVPVVLKTPDDTVYRADTPCYGCGRRKHFKAFQPKNDTERQLQRKRFDWFVGFEDRHGAAYVMGAIGDILRQDVMRRREEHLTPPAPSVEFQKAVEEVAGKNHEN